VTRRARLGAFTFQSGETIPNLELAYQTYGRYDGSNAVLVCHALTGSHHIRDPVASGSDTASGFDGPPSAAGWWEEVVGPDKPIDTTEQYVICANVPGSCHGSSGPASERADADGDGERSACWGSEFPAVSIADWTRAQRRLLDHLGVGRLRAVVGGSVGGMNALDWAKRYPDRVERVAAIATGPRLDTECLALNAIARRAITSDPAWHGGDYSRDGDDPRPTTGLAQARRIAHVMYRSKESLSEQFGRETTGRRSPLAAADPTAEAGSYREIESYLDYNAERFAAAFDAGSYLRLLRAMDEYDLAAGAGSDLSAGAGSDFSAGAGSGERAGSDAAALSEFDGELLLVSYTGDWHFPVESAETVAVAAGDAEVAVEHHVVDSEYGHDAFLAEQETVAEPLAGLFDDGEDIPPPEKASLDAESAPVHAGLLGGEVDCWLF
jgi:homoserine O-acetyltransferase